MSIETEFTLAFWQWKMADCWSVIPPSLRAEQQQRQHGTEERAEC